MAGNYECSEELIPKAHTTASRMGSPVSMEPPGCRDCQCQAETGQSVGKLGEDRRLHLTLRLH